MQRDGAENTARGWGWVSAWCTDGIKIWGLWHNINFINPKLIVSKMKNSKIVFEANFGFYATEFAGVVRKEFPVLRGGSRLLRYSLVCDLIIIKKWRDVRVKTLITWCMIYTSHRMTTTAHQHSILLYQRQAIWLELQSIGRKSSCR